MGDVNNAEDGGEGRCYIPGGGIHIHDSGFPQPGYPGGVNVVDGGYPGGVNVVDGGYPEGVNVVDGYPEYPGGVHVVDGCVQPGFGGNLIVGHYPDGGVNFVDGDGGGVNFVDGDGGGVNVAEGYGYGGGPMMRGGKPEGEGEGKDEEEKETE